MSDDAQTISDAPKKKQTTSNVASFLSGGVGGVAAVLVGQSRRHSDIVQSAHYNSVVHRVPINSHSLQVIRSISQRLVCRQLRKVPTLVLSMWLKRLLRGMA